MWHGIRVMIWVLGFLMPLYIHVYSLFGLVLLNVRIGSIAISADFTTRAAVLVVLLSTGVDSLYNIPKIVASPLAPITIIAQYVDRLVEVAFL